MNNSREIRRKSLHTGRIYLAERRAYVKIWKNTSRKNHSTSFRDSTEERLKNGCLISSPLFHPSMMNHKVTKDTISFPYETIARSRVNRSKYFPSVCSPGNAWITWNPGGVIHNINRCNSRDEHFVYNQLFAEIFKNYSISKAILFCLLILQRIVQILKRPMAGIFQNSILKVKVSEYETNSFIISYILI